MDQPVADVMAVAKRSLQAGEILDSFGGYTFYGVMGRSEDISLLRALPVGLAPGARVVRAVAAGDIVTWDDEELDEQSTVVKLRHQQDVL